MLVSYNFETLFCKGKGALEFPQFCFIGKHSGPAIITAQRLCDLTKSGEIKGFDRWKKGYFSVFKKNKGLKGFISQAIKGYKGSFANLKVSLTGLWFWIGSNNWFWKHLNCFWCNWKWGTLDQESGYNQLCFHILKWNTQSQFLEILYLSLFEQFKTDSRNNSNFCLNCFSKLSTSLYKKGDLFCTDRNR